MHIVHLYSFHSAHPVHMALYFTQNQFSYSSKFYLQTLIKIVYGFMLQIPFRVLTNSKELCVVTIILSFLIEHKWYKYLLKFGKEKKNARNLICYSPIGICILLFRVYLIIGTLYLIDVLNFLNSKINNYCIIYTKNGSEL